MTGEISTTPPNEEIRAQYEDRLIPLDQIDPPADAERETMEEAELADLALNISEIGLIKPLVVFQRGARFEVIAGHRRFLACGIANYSPVPCRVKVAGLVDPDAIKVAENAHVEPINAIEEARFYQRLLSKSCSNDTEVLCLKVRRRREYVEDRLNLLLGYPEVVDALHQKKISIALARELNKVKDHGRLLILLDTSIQQGWSARQLAEWRKQGEGLGPVQFADANPADQANNPAAETPQQELQCFFCGSTRYPSMMQFLYLHHHCMEALLTIIDRKNVG